jgi:hypothetical protein
MNIVYNTLLNHKYNRKGNFYSYVARKFWYLILLTNIQISVTVIKLCRYFLLLLLLREFATVICARFRILRDVGLQSIELKFSNLQIQVLLPVGYEIC